ncbi:MAG TPA: hypothetical protein VGJ15_03110 [Pirellulales bacterium]|jgi:hypothetical protein
MTNQIQNSKPEPARQYSLRELRAVDFLAIVFAGFGGSATFAGFLRSNPSWIVGGLGLFITGIVLNIKLKRVRRSGGFENTIQ